MPHLLILLFNISQFFPFVSNYFEPGRKNWTHPDLFGKMAEKEGISW